MKNAEARGARFLSHYVTTADGVRLRYFDTETSLPTLVLANGLGGPVSAWDPYLKLLAERFRLIAWDYRGLYGSTIPVGGADLSVLAHARDVACILDNANVKIAGFFGWSMGVQVGLEFYSQTPRRVSHLALVNGTYGRPLRGVPLPFSELTLPPLVQGARRLHGLGSRLLRGASRSQLSYPLLRKLRVVAPGLDRAHFQTMIEQFHTVDLNIYFDLLAKLGEHDAEHLLPGVHVPTLVICGSRDILTPPWLARKIAALVPEAQLYVISGGTHYAPAEYPSLVAARIEQFFRTKVEPAVSPPVLENRL